MSATGPTIDDINAAFADAVREDAERCDIKSTSSDFPVIQARGRLAIARKAFEHRGWTKLPLTTRGMRILLCCADHAWLANPTNPRQGVRNWLKRHTRLSHIKIDFLVEIVEKRGKRWTNDQFATTLEITVLDRMSISGDFRFVGASDDDDGIARAAINRAKDAARKRASRAANSTGRKPGRPATLNLSPEEKKARSNAQAAKRMRNMRALRKTPSEFLESIKKSDAIKRNISRPIVVQAIETISTINLDGIAFETFGIVALQLKHGNRTIREWRAP